MKLTAYLALIAFYSSLVQAQQPHIHGQTVPDWYDASCCNQRDCKPVEDSEIVFEQFEGQWVARYVPTGNRFSRNQFRVSQDERYHVCINKSTDASICFYDRSGA